MATIANGITGGFSGNVGNVIGSSWNGIDYMRSRATNISNPRTPAQLEQRARFSTVGKFLRPLTAFLRIGFKDLAIKQSAHNAAMAYNLENAITGVYPAFAVDYSKVSVSHGLLAGALNPVVASTLAGKVDFTWDDNSQEVNADATDLAMLVIYNPTRNQSVTIAGGNTRQSGSQTFTVPNSFEGEEVQCYIAFQNSKQSEVSDSQYVNSLIVT